MVTLREAVDLSCEVEANPPARLLWSVDGVTRAEAEARSVIRAGAAVRCLAENPLGVATAENTEMRLRGLERRVGELRERARTGEERLGELAGTCAEISHLETVKEQLEEKIEDMEKKARKSIREEREEWAQKIRTDLIKILEEKLVLTAGYLKQDIDETKAKVSYIDARIVKMDEKVAEIGEAATIPEIEINKFLDHSRATSSLPKYSSRSAASQKDHQGLVLCILVFILKVALF